MEQTAAAADALAAIAARDTWTADDVKELSRKLYQVSDAPSKCAAMLAELEAKDPQAKGAAALKIGMLRYMLCRFDAALAALNEATDNKDRRYYQAMCHKAMRQYSKAAEEFALAEKRGWEKAEIDVEQIELQALGGELEAANKALAKAQNKLGQTAAWWYLKGMVDELGGFAEQAVTAYEKALSVDPAHTGAAFRLAYFCDLHGEEDQAMELYGKCLASPPIYANALLNMAILYEDRGQFDKSASCLSRILIANPIHVRARLFLKDVGESKTMYYDEEQAKRMAKRNAVLDIPVTDFELSVRARNCLKKMNIRTLGDLINTTEPHLLAYKNFGETSLKEIKDMLASKGLHLGQALEEQGEVAVPKPPAAPSGTGDEGILAKPIDQLELSVRSRRALESLNIATLGDLVAKSESDLMGCKNFGQTSLNEIRQRLADQGLKLRETE